MARVRYIILVGALFALGMLLRGWTGADRASVLEPTDPGMGDDLHATQVHDEQGPLSRGKQPRPWTPQKRDTEPSLPLLNDVEEEGLAEARGFFPRPVEEWQGMLVRLEDMPVCEQRCSQPFACIDGQCAPCVKDSECESGESCVLDHCIQSENVTCKSRSDCAADQFCVLSDYPEPDPDVEIDPLTYRGNEGMRASCEGISGGSDPVAPTGPDQVAEPEREVDPLRDHLAALLEAE